MFQLDSDRVSMVFCALESIHAALAVMAHDHMPKQLYKEEVHVLFIFLLNLLLLFLLTLISLGFSFYFV